MVESLATCSTALHEVVVAAKAIINQPPLSPPQGVAGKVSDTPLHIDLLQAPQIARSSLAPQIRPVIPPPASQPEALSGF